MYHDVTSFLSGHWMFSSARLFKPIWYSSSPSSSCCCLRILPHVCIKRFFCYLLPLLGLEERDGGPFANWDCLYIILLYCLGICVEWLALTLPPRLNLLHDIFAVSFAFIICNYVFFNEIPRLVLFSEWTRITNINRGSLWILLYFSFCMPFAFLQLVVFLLWRMVYAGIFHSWRYNRCYSSRTTKTIAHWSIIRSLCWLRIHSPFRSLSYGLCY